MSKFSKVITLAKVGSLFGITGATLFYVTEKEKERQKWFKSLPQDEQEKIRSSCPLTYQPAQLDGIAAVKESMCGNTSNKSKKM